MPRRKISDRRSQFPVSSSQLGDGKSDQQALLDHIRISEVGRSRLRKCPAAVAGYQLFRQQALAEALAKSGKYDLVVTSVAYDERNEDLIRSMQSAGIEDFRKDWASLFTGQAQFASFSHQAWVRWIRENDAGAQWRDWLEWIVERYTFAE